MSTLKCGFDSLKEDVAVLESASSELLHMSSEIGPCLEEHNQGTEKQLPNIKKLVEDKNQQPIYWRNSLIPVEGLAGN